MSDELNDQDLEAVAGGYSVGSYDYIAREGETIIMIAGKTNTELSYLLYLNRVTVMKCYKNRHPEKKVIPGNSELCQVPLFEGTVIKIPINNDPDH